MLSLSVFVEAHPEHADAFAQAALQHAANSLKNEVDCLRFEVYRSKEEPHRFYFHEVYTCREAVDEHHVTSSYFADYKKKTATWVKSTVIQQWNSFNPKV